MAGVEVRTPARRKTAPRIDSVGGFLPLAPGPNESIGGLVRRLPQYLRSLMRNAVSQSLPHCRARDLAVDQRSARRGDVETHPRRHRSTAEMLQPLSCGARGRPGHCWLVHPGVERRRPDLRRHLNRGRPLAQSVTGGHRSRAPGLADRVLPGSRPAHPGRVGGTAHHQQVDLAVEGLRRGQSRTTPVPTAPRRPGPEQPLPL